MQVVFLSPHSDPEADLGEPDAGGQCVYEHQLALALSEKGVPVTTFCRQTGVRKNRTEVNENYSIFRITTSKPKFIAKEQLEKELAPFVEGVFSVLKKVNKREEKMVLHGHYWDGAKVALLFKYNFEDVPMVWTPHSLGAIKRSKFSGIVHEFHYNFLPRILWENYAAYLASRVVVSSQDEKQKLLTRYGIVRDHVDVVPPGIDFSVFEAADAAEARAAFGIDADSFVLLALGRMARMKGYGHALQLMAELKRTSDKPYVLVIVGGSIGEAREKQSQYERELRRLARELSIEDRVVFHSAVPHAAAADVFAMADVFLMTSENEPFGLTTIEAMASKTVVLGHFRGGTRSIIQHGKTGFLVDMNNYPQTAQLLEEILSKPKVAKDLREAAYEQVQERYSWSSRAVDFVQLYEQVSQYNGKTIHDHVEDNYFLQKNLEV